MKVKDAIKQVADKFYLSYHHVGDIWYLKVYKPKDHKKLTEQRNANILFAIRRIKKNEKDDFNFNYAFDYDFNYLV